MTGKKTTTTSNESARQLRSLVRLPEGTGSHRWRRIALAALLSLVSLAVIVWFLVQPQSQPGNVSPFSSEAQSLAAVQSSPS